MGKQKAEPPTNAAAATPATTSDPAPANTRGKLNEHQPAALSAASAGTAAVMGSVQTTMSETDIRGMGLAEEILAARPGGGADLFSVAAAAFPVMKGPILGIALIWVSLT